MSKQSKLSTFLTSQVGRKLLTGITGVLLVLYVIIHLAGNLSLLSNDPMAINKYGAFLERFGALLLVIELGLALVIIVHAIIGIQIYLRKRKARASGYEMHKSKGEPSKMSISSRTMIVTGIVLLVFLVIHVIQFRFHPGVESGYGVSVDGDNILDLRRIAFELFSNIWWVIFYVAVMVLLGFHLRHGIWSMLQSLGAMKPRYTPVVYSLALILGIILAVGFIFLPIWIYFHRSAI